MSILRAFAVVCLGVSGIVGCGGIAVMESDESTPSDDGEGGGGTSSDVSTTGSTSTVGIGGASSSSPTVGGGTSVSSSGSGGGDATSSSSGVGGEGGGGTVDQPFKITLSETTPASRIIVGGKNEWVVFSEYDVENLTDQHQDVWEAVITQFDPNGDAADIVTVGVSMSNFMALKTSVSVYWDPNTFEAYPYQNGPTGFGFPPHYKQKFLVVAKTAAPQSSSAVNGAWHGVPRSGHTPALRLVSIRSGYPGVTSVAATDEPPSMVLRKSQPIVTKQPLLTETLYNIDQDLIKFQVAADSAGPIALKQVVFSFSKSSATSLSNFRLRRGATDLDIAAYAVTSGTSLVDLQSGTLAAGVNSGFIVVSMKPGQEESISGSGSFYTVHASVSGAVPGQNVTLSFYRDPTAPVVTGYISNFVFFGDFGSSANVFHIDTSSAPTAGASATGTFLWSDNSEVPHSSMVQASRDWTNDVYVQDLSQSQTLSL